MVVANVWQALGDGIFNAAPHLFAVLVLSLAGYFAALRSIPPVMVTLFQRNIYGIDINKTTPETRAAFGKMRQSGSMNDEYKRLVIPESLGIVVGGIYLCIVLLAVFALGLPLAKANGAITSIAVMLLLGFVDDVLDVRWRYKLVLSFFGSLPLLMSYDGPLSVMIPVPLRALLNDTTVLYIGPLYLVYLALLCVFCTNSINILAGVNGVEVGQSIVIGAASLVYNVVQLRHIDDEATQQQHLLAITLLGPFLGVSLALWAFNKYPSRVFVGDSYTYFAGIVLAVSGISAAYSKTLLLFFVPQLFNFVISLPQLFHIVPCPRHRVPTWNAKTDKLANSRNYTLLNTVLWIVGDLHEKTLTNVIIWIQILCCLGGFGIRFFLAGLVYERVV